MPRIRSDAFSASIIVGAWVAVLGQYGIADASATLRPVRPVRPVRPCTPIVAGSSTESSSTPIRQVEVGRWRSPHCPRCPTSSCGRPVAVARVRRQTGVLVGLPAAVAALVLVGTWLLTPRLGLSGAGVALLGAQAVAALAVLVGPAAGRRG